MGHRERGREGVREGFLEEAAASALHERRWIRVVYCKRGKAFAVGGRGTLGTGQEVRPCGIFEDSGPEKGAGSWHVLLRIGLSRFKS